MHRNKGNPSSKTSPESPAQASGSRLTVCTLASGSKGNAIYVSNGQTSILIDAGLSGIEIQRRLDKHRISANEIDAIVVSHEHTDHIKGVGVLSRKFNLPVYITQKTKQSAETVLGKIEQTEHFTCGRAFQIQDLILHPFSTSHDAEDPAGFTISHNGIKMGIATDLGIATRMVKEHLKGSSLVIIEANHDVTMLETGPYPWPVKQRIKSRLGHLSNTDSKELLSDIQHPNLKHVILGHLSDTNNTPEKAIRDVSPALSNGKIRLDVAVQDRCGKMITIK